MRLLKKMFFNNAYIPIVLAFGSNSGKLLSLLLNGSFALKLQNNYTTSAQKICPRFFRGGTEL